jgi:hypothetical protein
MNPGGRHPTNLGRLGYEPEGPLSVKQPSRLE